MNNSTILTSRFGIAAGWVALMISTSAFAADATKEVASAEQHTTLAAGSDNIKAVHMHLHHAINCLVGPDGAAFDANEMNPCKDLGNGAIPDTTDVSGKKVLEKAVKTAQSGIDSDNLAAAQKAATETAAMLKVQ